MHGDESLTERSEATDEGLWRVQHAVHSELDCHVTLKTHTSATKRVLHEDYLNLIRELDSAGASVQFVRPLDSGRTLSGLSFFAFPLLSATPLQRDLRPTSSLNWQPAVEVLRETARLLVPVHDAGLSHGHISPNSILLTPGATPAIADFGLYLFESKQKLRALGSDQGLALAYRAPEAIDAKPPTPRTDVYGLAISLWARLSGFAPFLEDEPDNDLLIHRIQTEEPSPLPDHIPVEVQEFIHRALSKNPADRQVDASEFLADLEAAVGPAPSIAHQPAFIPAVQTRSSLNLGLVPRVAVVATFLLGLGAFAAFATSRSPSGSSAPSEIRILGTTTISESPTESTSPSPKSVSTIRPVNPTDAPTTAETSTTVPSAITSSPRSTRRPTTRPAPTTTQVTQPTTTSILPTTQPVTSTTEGITIKPGPTTTATPTTAPTTTTEPPTTTTSTTEPTTTSLVVLPTTTELVLPTITLPTITLTLP